MPARLHQAREHLERVFVVLYQKNIHCACVGELLSRDSWEKTVVVAPHVQASLQIGQAGQQICARAAEDDADLIVTLVAPSHDRPEIPEVSKRGAHETKVSF